MLTNQPAVQVDQVCFFYDEEPALDHISLTVEPGDFLGLVGPNGGGKTTLLKIILGLLHPQQGSVLIFGAQPKQAYSQVGYVPQFINLDKDFPINVLNVVMMGLLSTTSKYCRFRIQDKERAKHALSQVDLAHVWDRPFGALSGGQRQRVLIARGIVGNPKLLIMDEPTAHVDSYSQGQLFELLNKINKECTIIIVSHDIGFVSTHINKVACLNRQLVLHPTREFEPDVLEHLFHTPMKMVDHSSHL